MLLSMQTSTISAVQRVDPPVLCRGEGRGDRLVAKLADPEHELVGGDLEAAHRLRWHRSRGAVGKECRRRHADGTDNDVVISGQAGTAARRPGWCRCRGGRRWTRPSGPGLKGRSEGDEKRQGRQKPT